jgi:hypothetical protein
MAANVIRGVDDLERVVASGPVLYPGPSLRLEVAALAKPEQEMWQKRLNRHYAICGCQSSAWFVILAMIGYVVFLLVAPAGTGPAGWARLPWGVIVVLASGLVGKLIGLGVGAFLFRRSVRLLRARLSA